MFLTVLVNLAGLGVCLSAQTILILNAIPILSQSIWKCESVKVWKCLPLSANNLHPKRNPNQSETVKVKVWKWKCLPLSANNLHPKRNPNPLPINLKFTGIRFKPSFTISKYRLWIFLLTLLFTLLAWIDWTFAFSVQNLIFLMNVVAHLCKFQSFLWM